MFKSKDNYHLKVIIVTWLGWLFDGMDSSLYPLVANQALSELIGKDNPIFGSVASQVLAIFLVGWGLGGFIFGYLGDKIGRVKALAFSIFTYAIFSGLSGFSGNIYELAFFRFLTGLGIGGEWALGVSLLAEVIPAGSRIKATGFLATGFAFGYLLAIIVNYLVSPFGWRWVFFLGIIPAFLVYYILTNIKESEIWEKLEIKAKSPFEIFEKKYLKNLRIAFLLGLTFSIGSWGCVIFWFPIWLERTLGCSLEEKTCALIIFMLPHIVGCYLAALLLEVYKRRIILFVGYFFSFLSALIMYSCFKTYGLSVIAVSSLLGIFFGMIPSSLAVYFPELFSVKIRSTAEGFCYNTGRVFTAIGALFSGYLVQKFSGNIGASAALMSFIFLLGAIVSLFAPETDKSNLPV